MTLYVCVDDKLGMAFMGRRQSRDRAVYEDIALRCGDAPLYMDARSQALFLQTSVVPSSDAHGCEHLFLEFCSPAPFMDGVDTIVLYRWNRRYPADLYFDVSLEGFTYLEGMDFKGTSHETITREVYTREQP
ncbi:MAG: ribonuclease Z [Clostridiales bacterium]|nr:ribonuclease Z [Clostridiales bacterium]